MPQTQFLGARVLVASKRRLRVVALSLTVIATLLVSSPVPVSSQASNPGDCVAMTDSISRLYSAYFLRAPDASGYAYWSGEFAGGRRGLQGMSDFFATSDEFRNLYADLSNREFVQLVYQNVLDRQPDPAGLDFWTSRLDEQAMTRGTVMINFSESAEYVQLTDTIPPLAGYFNWYPEGTTFTCGFGPVGHSTAGKSQLDVVSFHIPEIAGRGSSLAVRTTSNGQTKLIGEDYVPYQHLYREQFPPSQTPAADEVISVQAGSQVLTYIVSYNGDPMIDFDLRGGQKPDERARPTTTEFFEDIEGAVTVVDTFWRSYFGASYQSPRVVGTYDGFSSNVPTCAGQPLAPLNAYYCIPADYVAWDVNLLSLFYAVQGDGLVYLLVAHEWGHAIQARLDPSQVALQKELQADCLGGAALAGSSVSAFRTDGGGGLIWEEGDVAEIFAALTAIADETPWSNASDHGNDEERIDAFVTGTQGGVAACLAG